MDIVVESKDNCIGDGGVFVGCCGYEHRSIYSLNEYTNSEVQYRDVLVFDYSSVGLHSYERNIEFLKKVKVDGFFIDKDWNIFLSVVRERICTGAQVEVHLDISSMDGRRLSEILLLLFEYSDFIKSVCILYSPQVFSDFKRSFDVVQSFGPISPIFVGDTRLQSRGLTLLIGCGYEYGKVVGSIEYLEPDTYYCYRPTGTDEKFDRSIDSANIGFDFIDEIGNLASYNLLDAVGTYYELRRLIEYEKNENQVLVLSMGPKLFTALSLLISIVHHPEVLVWRHSTTATNLPSSTQDALPSGEIVTFCFRFQS